MTPLDVRPRIKGFKMQKTNSLKLLGWGIFFLAVSALFAFVIGNSLIANASQQESSNQQQGIPNSHVTKLTFDKITMYVSDAYQEGKYFQVNVCFSLPDDRDWLITSHPNDATLNVNNQTYTVIEEGVLDIKPASDGVEAEKCQYLLFPVKVEDNSSLSLFINKIYVSEPDKVDCPALQEKLNEKNSGIQVSCPTESNLGGFQVVQKPDSMDNNSAYEAAFDLLTDAQRASWVFHFEFPLP